MVFSYMRICCSLEEAMARYVRWIGGPRLGCRSCSRKVTELTSHWTKVSQQLLGLAVFVYESKGWAVIEEVSGSRGWSLPRSGSRSPRMAI